MKKSIILDVFNERKGFNSIEMTDKHKDLLDNVANIEQTLTSLLNDEQKELFRKYDLAQGDVIEEEINEFYIEGFKLGLLIGIECMDD